MDDDRGNLAFEFLRIAGESRPRWLVWENVPGVLSLDGGRAFGSILGGLVELGYGFAYRILDAQYIRVDSHPRAVPQRRRRVFVIGHLGDWRPPVAVLFEPESMSWNPAPRREAGQSVASLTANGVGTCGADDNQAQAGHLIASEVAPPLTAGHDRGVHASREGLLVAHQAIAPPLTSNPYGDHESREGLLIPFDTTQITHTENRSKPQPGDPSPPLAAHGHAPAIAFSSKDHGADASVEVSPTLRAMGHDTSHANAGGQVAVVMQERMESMNPDNGPNGKGWNDTGAAFTMEARNKPQAVAFAENSRAEVRLEGGDGSVSGCLIGGGGKPGQSYPAVLDGMVVRRITPIEAERLQGFEDDYTLVPYRGKPMANGPRYRMLGDSMATNVMRFIGERIQMFEHMTKG